MSANIFSDSGQYPYPLIVLALFFFGDERLACGS